MNSAFFQQKIPLITRTMFLKFYILLKPSWLLNRNSVSPLDTHEPD